MLAAAGGAACYPAGEVWTLRISKPDDDTFTEITHSYEVSLGEVAQYPVASLDLADVGTYRLDWGLSMTNAAPGLLADYADYFNPDATLQYWDGCEHSLSAPAF